MTKNFYILLLMMFGYFMMPSRVCGCGMIVKKTGCKETSISKIKEVGCCAKENNTKDKNNTGCNGASKHVSCNCPSILLALLFNTEFTHQFCCFFPEKQNYYYSEIFISSDFRSVWHPPKIS